MKDISQMLRTHLGSFIGSDRGGGLDLSRAHTAVERGDLFITSSIKLDQLKSDWSSDQWDSSSHERGVQVPQELAVWINVCLCLCLQTPQGWTDSSHHPGLDLPKQRSSRTTSRQQNPQVSVTWPVCTYTHTTHTYVHSRVRQQPWTPVQGTSLFPGITAEGPVQEVLMIRCSHGQPANPRSHCRQHRRALSNSWVLFRSPRSPTSLRNSLSTSALHCVSQPH